MTGLDSVRKFCLSLPDVAENIQWEDVLLFRVGGRKGKIFVMVSLNPAAADRIAFKCDPERFAELLERDGARPAAYVGRYQWIGLRGFNVLPAVELRDGIRASYDLVAAKLPGKKATTRTPAYRSQRASRRLRNAGG